MELQIRRKSTVISRTHPNILITKAMILNGVMRVQGCCGSWTLVEGNEPGKVASVSCH